MSSLYQIEQMTKLTFGEVIRGIEPNTGHANPSMRGYTVFLTAHDFQDKQLRSRIKHYVKAISGCGRVKVQSPGRDFERKGDLVKLPQGWVSIA